MGQALEVLAVSADRETLRTISRFLRLFDYRIVQLVSCADATRVVEKLQPHIVVVDGRLPAAEVSELCAAGRGRSKAGFSFPFFLVEDPTVQEVRRALAAGFEDFLQRPLVYGEVLARFRVAARIVELERRRRRISLGEGSPEDSRPILPMHAWRVRLSDLMAGNRHSLLSVALVDLDLLDCLNREHGWPAGDVACGALADALVSAGTEGFRLAECGPGRFAIMLDGLDDEQAQRWLEQVSRTYGDVALKYGDAAFHATFSGAVIQVAHPMKVDQILPQLEDTLREAKSSGRGLSMRVGSLKQELDAWRKKSESLFSETAARDLMTYCPTVASLTDSIEKTLDTLLGSRLSVIPVADERQQTAGIVTIESVRERLSQARGNQVQLRDVVDRNAPNIDEEASFGTLMDLFAGESITHLVVSHAGSPSGIISRESLAALNEPLTADAFFQEPTWADVGSLVVPD